MSELAFLLSSIVFAPPSQDDAGDTPRHSRRFLRADAVDPVGGGDQTLVQKIRAGDQNAFAEMFQQYAPALAAFIERYVKDAAVAEELVQDVFLWILRNRDTWTVRGSVRAYLYRAARNYAFDFLKHRAVEQRWASTSANVDDVAVPVDAVATVIADEQVARLAWAITQLPESRQTALTLRWMDGLSYAEIASILGSSPKAVEVQLNRTLRQLRSLIGHI